MHVYTYAHPATYTSAEPAGSPESWQWCFYVLYIVMQSQKLKFGMNLQYLLLVIMHMYYSITVRLYMLDKI